MRNHFPRFAKPIKSWIKTVIDLAVQDELTEKVAILKYAILWIFEQEMLNESCEVSSSSQSLALFR